MERGLRTRECSVTGRDRGQHSLYWVKVYTGDLYPGNESRKSITVGSYEISVVERFSLDYGSSLCSYVGRERPGVSDET